LAYRSIDRQLKEKDRTAMGLIVGRKALLSSFSAKAILVAPGTKPTKNDVRSKGRYGVGSGPIMLGLRIVAFDPKPTLAVSPTSQTKGMLQSNH
jgi:hypothetical protein